MKKPSKIGLLLLAAGLVLALAGCPTDAGDGEETSGVSFESFSPPSIYVDNASGSRLVAFKGSLNPNYLISGIPAYASNHGLKKSASLFSTTGDFALILVTEEEYIKNKSNPAACDVFAEIYAFYNNEATNDNRFKISSKSGGTGRITLNNPTMWNVEIRRNGPTGEVLGYVAAYMMNTVLRVNAPDDYDLFPVFKKFNQGEKEIYEAVPKYITGELQGQPYMKSIGLATANGTSTWNLSDLANALTMDLTSGSVYLRIQNNSGVGIRFYRGDDAQLTSMGIQLINPSNTNTYAIKLERLGDKTYPAQETIGQLKIGGSQRTITIPSQAFKLDYVYTIIVNGTDLSTLTLGSITESAQPLDVNQMFGW